MTGVIDTLPALGNAVFDGLVRASVQGGVFILLVWLVSRLPHLPASVRCALWWLASLKLLVALVCIDPLPIPVLPAAEPSQEARVEFFSNSAGRDPATDRGVIPTPSRQAGYQVTTVAVGVWAAIVILLIAALVGRMRNLNRVADRASQAPPELQEVADRLAESLGLSPPPAVCFSEEIGTPLVLGLWRPKVLLPAAAFASLGDEEQRMALCHELVHLHRRDLWLAHVPALAERLFFFHPLVHRAVREYQMTREAACDAAVIQRLGAGAGDYGRLLLALGASRVPIHLAAAGSPSSYLKLKRRITMLRDIRNYSPRWRRTGWAAILLAALAITPLTLVSRSQDRPRSAAAPRLPRPATSVSPAVAPALPAVPAVPAVPSQAGVSFQESARQGSRERHKDLKYILFLDDQHTMMSGSTEDIGRAESLRKGNEQMLWFRREGREYVVRDPALLQQVQEIFRPLREIGGDQAKVGEKQAEIGRRQADIGNKQAEVGQKQAEIGAQQARIGARQAAFAAREAGNESVRKEAPENERRQIELEMQGLEKQMRELSSQMQTLERPMQDLNKEMNSFSQEMNVLSRKMEEASAKAEAEMSGFLDQAISSGKATEVK